MNTFTVIMTTIDEFWGIPTGSFGILLDADKDGAGFIQFGPEIGGIWMPPGSFQILGKL